MIFIKEKGTVFVYYIRILKELTRNLQFEISFNNLQKEDEIFVCLFELIQKIFLTFRFFYKIIDLNNWFDDSYDFQEKFEMIISYFLYHFTI